MCADSIESAYSELEHFLQQLKSNGWLADDQIVLAENRNASDLFKQDHQSRPLVVGLFGGTGVGKSTLLNRLAGENIAKTGVVRPTSLEITAYLHDSREVDSLPDNFAVSNFNCIKHSNRQLKDVMWVDMPDFDSDETQNRERVLQWIPHIDLLIYVVTPERYRDEQGWRLLMSEGYRHGWLFVMNQWDKAESSQMDDFVRLVKSTGFNQPKVFRTVGMASMSDSDEFDQLADLIAELAERNAVEQLEQVGWFRKLEKGKEQLARHQQLLQPLDKDLVEWFDLQWNKASDRIRDNLSLPINQYAARFSESHDSALKNAVSAVAGSVENAKKIEFQSIAQHADALWDEWSQIKVADAITEFELTVTEQGFPPQRLARLSAELGAIDIDTFGKIWPDRVAQAMVNPGPLWQRSLQKVFSWLKLLLPLAAIGWVASRVLAGFVDGASNPDAYVGTGIIVNGALLIVAAWALPWLAGLLTRPSVPKAVSSALHDQLQSDLIQSASAYRAGLKALGKEQIRFKEEALTLQRKIDTAMSRSTILQSEDVRALLMQTPAISAASQHIPDNAES